MTLDEQIEAVEFKISMARHISADIFILASLKELKELKAMKESHQSAFRMDSKIKKGCDTCVLDYGKNYRCQTCMRWRKHAVFFTEWICRPSLLKPEPPKEQT